MPEGDTIHTLANALRPRLHGERLVGGELRDAPGVSLAGLQVADVSARGKHLFIDFTDGDRLRSHLGMHGSWHRYAPNEAWRRPQRQASIVLRTERDVFVCFNASQVEMRAKSSIERARGVRELGPDLAAETVDFDAALLRAGRFVARHPDAPIVDLLLDQRVASGIGNVYKSELLFLAHVHPLARAYTIEAAVLLRIYRDAHELLRLNQHGGARVTVRRARARSGGSEELWVYRRAGEPCRGCGARVETARLGRGQRSTYWCPACQPRSESRR